MDLACTGTRVIQFANPLPKLADSGCERLRHMGLGSEEVLERLRASAASRSGKGGRRERPSKAPEAPAEEPRQRKRGRRASDDLGETAASAPAPAVLAKRAVDAWQQSVPAMALRSLLRGSKLAAHGAARGGQRASS